MIKKNLIGYKLVPAKHWSGGYNYIYVSNESTLNANVYFDDMKVTHEHSPLVQVNAYYPYGLAMEGLSYDREAAAANLYGFNGMENNEEVGLYSTSYRMYNPSLGRFNGVDPATSILFTLPLLL